MSLMGGSEAGPRLWQPSDQHACLTCPQCPEYPSLVRSLGAMWHEIVRSPSRLARTVFLTWVEVFVGNVSITITRPARTGRHLGPLASLCRGSSGRSTSKWKRLRTALRRVGRLAKQGCKVIDPWRWGWPGKPAVSLPVSHQPELPGACVPSLRSRWENLGSWCWRAGGLAEASSDWWQSGNCSQLISEVRSDCCSGSVTSRCFCSRLVFEHSYLTSTPPSAIPRLVQDILGVSSPGAVRIQHYSKQYS